MPLDIYDIKSKIAASFGVAIPNEYEYCPNVVGLIRQCSIPTISNIFCLVNSILQQVIKQNRQIPSSFEVSALLFAIL